MGTNPDGEIVIRYLNQIRREVKEAEASRPPVSKYLKRIRKRVKQMAITENLFTVLGLDFKHRSKFFQEVRHREEVVAEKNRTDFPYIADIKYDGNFAAVLVQKGEAKGIYSRTGNAFTNTDIILGSMKKLKFKKDGLYICELYCPRDLMSLEKFQALHGPSRTRDLTAPQVEFLKTESRLAFFDFITIEEFTEGKSDTPCEDRRGTLAKALKCKKTGGRAHLVETYIVQNEKELKAVFKQAIKQGEEGIVIKSPKHPYVCGHKNYHFMKIVKGLAYDLECVGFEEGTGKFEGMVGKLQFRFRDGHVINAGPGKGYTHEDLAKMLEDAQAKPKKSKKDKKGKKKDKQSTIIDSVVGKIFKVTALEESSGGKDLRLPKFQEIRHDKEQADF